MDTVTCPRPHNLVETELSLCFPFTPCSIMLSAFCIGKHLPTSSGHVAEVVACVRREVSWCPSILAFPSSSAWNSEETFTVAPGPFHPGWLWFLCWAQARDRVWSRRDILVPILELGTQSQPQSRAGNLFLVLHYTWSRGFHIFFNNN